MKNLANAALLTGAILALMSGCSSTTTFTTVPVETTVAATNAAVISYDTVWGYTTVDPFEDPFLFAVTAATVSSSFSPDQAATTAAASAGNYFAPAGCVQANASGATATFVFNGCTGLFGNKAISGTVTATYSQVTSGVQVQLASTNLVVNGAGLNLAVTGTVGQNGSSRTLTFNSTTLTTANTGGMRSFNGTLSWVKGSQCVSLTGNGTQVFNGTSYLVSLVGYQTCSGQCPKSGTLTVTGPSNTATLTYNGTSLPKAMNTVDNSNITVALSCP